MIPNSIDPDLAKFETQINLGAANPLINHTPSNNSPLSPRDQAQASPRSSQQGQMASSDSQVIGTLKPFYLMPKSANTISTQSKTLTAVPRLSVFSTITGHNLIENHSKLWQFEKSPNRRRMTLNDPTMLQETHMDTIQHIRKFSQNASELVEINQPSPEKQVNEFLNYEASSSSSIPSEGPKDSDPLEKLPVPEEKKSIAGSPVSTAHRPRANSIVQFREKNKFFELITSGKAADLTRLEAFLKSDPYQFIYDARDPMSLVNRPNPSGQRPLYVAAKHGNLEAMRLLVKYKADPALKSNIKLKEKVSAEESVLDAAARWNNTPILEYLLYNFEWSKIEKSKAASFSNSPVIQNMLLNKNKEKKETGANKIKNGEKKKKKSGFFWGIFGCFSSKKQKKHSQA
jgi:Ankyrin repeats (3 copies)